MATLEVDIGGSAPALVLAEDDRRTTLQRRDPRTDCCPALDPSVMGWTGRDFYLDPEHRDHTREAALFDRSGNPGPTVWWGGQIVGGWAQRKDGEVAVQPAGRHRQAKARQNVESEAARTAEILGDVRVTPRFRTAAGTLAGELSC